MTHETVNRLAAEHMKTVFGYAFSRLSDPNEAEILASDILYALLKSAPNLRDESKFYPFLWRIAENTFANYLRGKHPLSTDEFDESTASDPVQEEILLREDLALLRRELSLLSEEYRRATVLYYMEDKSCAEIAQALETSVEMVKYYLFRARKLLKEGMTMNRTFGEKSYNPQHFEIDFYGDHGGDDDLYHLFQQRKLPGNILVSAYYTPVTMQELSIELGVATPYLEDEINFLLAKHLLTRKNGKYQTNITVFTDRCTEEITEKIRPTVESAAKTFAETFSTAFRDRYGSRFPDENLLRWQAFFLCTRFAMQKFEKHFFEQYGSFPRDGIYHHLRGDAGIVWGRSWNSDPSDDSTARIYGIYEGTAADGRGTVHAINFGQILNAQHYTGYDLDQISCTAVGCFAYLPDDCKTYQRDTGYVTPDNRPNFAVYTPEEFAELPILLAPSINLLLDFLKQNLTVITRVTAEHAPEYIRKTAKFTGAFVYQFTGIQYLTETLFQSDWLKPVADTAKPALCVIDHTK